MNGDKRNFSLSLWDHNDNFICNLKTADSNFEGQVYNENFLETITGEKTLSFSIPMYIFSYSKDENGNDKFVFNSNESWMQIKNEQKIRYIEYNPVTSEPNRIEEFVLKEFTERRNGEEKIADCICESLAVYELGKVGWSISFNSEYVSKYELEKNDDDFLTLNYWLRKIFYKETNLGKISTTTEYTYFLQENQLRNEDGAPIDSIYTTNENGDINYNIISEPVCTLTETQLKNNKYYNPTGWTWSIQAKDVREPNKIVTTDILYENPTINKYIEKYFYGNKIYSGVSYQKIRGTSDNEKRLLPHPISEKDEDLVYVTDIKKRLFHIERSNIYNIIQELCNIFEVFAYFKYYYNDIGTIIKREIVFKTEAINEKINFDFSYGKNLLSCQRSTDSNELITKLIVPDTQSTFEEGKTLSIKQATANQTGEGYLYNFKYFYETGMLTTMDKMEREGKSLFESDEYKINYHCGILKDYNVNIEKLQKILEPLYDRQGKLNGDLLVQQSSRTAIIDNMQAIQDKIDAIPVEQQIINSWSQFPTQYNHIGEIKTIGTTTDEDGSEILYINFGREDIIFDNINVINYTIDKNNNIVEGENISIEGFIPRCYKNIIWNPSSESNIPDNNTNDFIMFNTSTRLDNHGDPLIKEVVYSKIRDQYPGFIKGIKLNYLPLENQSFIRIRYKYAPLAWYYLLIKDYWDQLFELENKINNINSELQEITNKILVNELNLNNLLQKKNEEILQFEKRYKPYIREGYWEANDYQGQVFSKSLYTGEVENTYEGEHNRLVPLKDLNLNESLSNYTRYIDLGIKATDIDIDSIIIRTKNPAYSAGGNTTLPRYRGNDYEIYIENDGNIIIGINPSLIDAYNKYNYSENYYACDLNCKKTNGQEIFYSDLHWSIIGQPDNPIIKERYIYLTNDNILTSTISVYGGSTTTNALSTNIDYTYNFEYIGYDENGIIVDLEDQSAYSNDIYYDYITKITLKNTNEVNKYNDFYITYDEESTLQYLYQDAIAMSDKYAEPKVTYTINIVDISSLDEYKDYKPEVGQKVPIYDTEMKFNGFEGFITSVSKVLEKPEQSQVTIATYTNKFEDVFQKLTATMSDIQYNENSIYKAADSFGETGVIKENVFQKSLIENSYQISLGTDNEVTIDKERGISLLDNENNSAVKLIGRGIFLTKDYKGDADSLWITGITGEGINANALVTGNINTKNINIWNATEGQIRFVWNEKGLTAYGPIGVAGSSTNSLQDFVNYDKYVRFNSEGLEFVDKIGENAIRSSLILGWDGLKIQAQENALQLDAENGLILQKNGRNRLELGKFNDSLYGLKLKDNNGDITFQTDSGGDLFLKHYIRIGGNINENGAVSNPNAGIFGIETISNSTETMGPRRNDQTGSPIWDNEPLRFWAGPRDKDTFLTEEPELYNSFSTQIQRFQTNSPALARFKVSKSGKVVASGIDVGGWIGGGKFLRSSDSEAVLRSGNYNENTLPVLAIGITTDSVISGVDSGRAYNFKVFRTGELDIGHGNFHVSPNGIVQANALYIMNGEVAGFTINNERISVISSNEEYETYLQGSKQSNSIAFAAGKRGNPQFKVFNNGEVSISGQGTNINGGVVGGLTISSNSLVFTTTEVIMPIEDSENTTITENTYTVGLYSVGSSTGIALQIGTTSISTNERRIRQEAAFKIQNNGKLYATNAEITGIITANSGKIGGSSGFTIIREDYNEGGTHSKIYSGKRSILSLSTDGESYIENSSNGIYLGTDGIALGSNNKFKVDTRGNLTARSGTIGGWEIDSSSLYNSNTAINDTYYVELKKALSKNSVIFSAGTTTGTDAEFWIKADGSVNASKLVIPDSNGNSSPIGTAIGTIVQNGISVIGGFDNTEGGLDSLTTITSKYYVGLNAPTESSNVVFYAGTRGKRSDKNEFNVKADGTVNATNLSITGGTINIGDKFIVDDKGNVKFKGTITGCNNRGEEKKGLTGASLTLYTGSGKPVTVEVCQGLIIDVN